jgi:hypothetical protein
MTDLDSLSHATAINDGATVFWVATLQDGSRFNQYEDGREHNSQEIDYSKLKTLALYHKDGRKLVEVEYEKGQYPIYRRRTAMRSGYGKVEVIHIVGWRTKEPDDHRVTFLFESSLAVHEGMFDGEGIRYPIQYLPHDEIPVS